MENTPIPDFEMHFYNGLRVHSSTARNSLEIKTPIDPQPVSSHSLHSSASENSLRKPSYTTQTFSLNSPAIPPSLHATLKHLKECLKTCLETPDAQDGRYPIILKSSVKQQGPISAASMQHHQYHAGNNIGDRSSSPSGFMAPPSIHLSTTLGASSYAHSAAPSAMKSSSPYLSRAPSPLPQQAEQQQHGHSAAETPSSTQRVAGYMVDHSMKDVVFLANVGWCMRIKSCSSSLRTSQQQEEQQKQHYQHTNEIQSHVQECDVFRMMFLDGSCMDLEARGKFLYLLESGGDGLRHCVTQ
jgi:hypothetical protein